MAFCACAMKRLILLLLFLAPPVVAQQLQYSSLPVPALSIAAKSYVLSDFQSGQILVSENAQERVEPASLTKLMTAYIVFSALQQKRLTLTQTVLVSEHARRVQGSRMFIEVNRPVTVDELMRG